MNQSWETEAKGAVLSFQQDFSGTNFVKDFILGIPTTPRMKILPSLPATALVTWTWGWPHIFILIAWVLTLFNRLTRCSSTLAFGVPHLLFPASHWILSLLAFSSHVARIHHFPHATCGKQETDGSRREEMCLQVWRERTLKVEPSYEKWSNGFLGGWYNKA